MSPARTMRALACAAFIATSAAAHAGRSCETRPPTVDAIQRSMTLAEHTANKLDQTGAQVVMLARIGQNLREYGLRYSHLGLAYRDDKGWKIVHKLNQCGSAVAAVYRQGLGEFFLDDMVRYEAGLVVQQPEVQAHLAKVAKTIRSWGVTYYKMDGLWTGDGTTLLKNALLYR